MSVPPSGDFPGFNLHFLNGTTPLVSPSHSITFSDTVSKMDSFPFNEYSDTEQLNAQWYNQELIFRNGAYQPHSQATMIDPLNAMTNVQYNQSVEELQIQPTNQLPTSWITPVPSPGVPNPHMWTQSQQHASQQITPHSSYNHPRQDGNVSVPTEIATVEKSSQFNLSQYKFLPPSPFSTGSAASPVTQPASQHMIERPSMSQMRHHSIDSAEGIQQVPQPLPSPSYLSHTTAVGTPINKVYDTQPSPQFSILQPPSTGKPPTRRTKSAQIIPVIKKTISSPLSLPKPKTALSSPSYSTAFLPQPTQKCPSPSPSTISHQAQLEGNPPQQQQQQQAKRKRGRPRLPRSPIAPTQATPATGTHATSTSGRRRSTTRPSKRQPHNMVERKYREGLNKEMERLRAALPHLSTSGMTSKSKSRKTKDGGGMSSGDEHDLDDSDGASDCDDGNDGGPVKGGGLQRASKAHVLQGAVEEIERLRGETDRLRRELQRVERERDRIKGG